jgi:Do/DeqQ family serine protease
MSLSRNAFFLALIAIAATVFAMQTAPRADASPIIAGEVPTLAPMLKGVLPAVVNIKISTRQDIQNPLMQDPFFRRFFGVPEQQQQRRSQEPQPVGSGVIVDARQGLVLTNHHVIAQADEIVVNLSDGRDVPAELVGSDPETDIAVLKIKPENIVALEVADSGALEVGDFVLAIGNPFGLGQTVTSGIVSALGRITGGDGYQDFIQTDAAINPGNSGGALIDLRGRLVGINSQILSRTGGNIGIGFAIPTNLAKAVMDQIVEHGDVQRGRIGIVGQSLSPELAKAFNIETARGVVVTQVVEDSPAAKAGVRAEDVIVQVDGREVRDMMMLRNTIGLKRVGETVRLRVIRDGRARNLNVTIGGDVETATSGERLHPRLAGAEITPIAEDHPLAGEVKGVMVRAVDPASVAARAGLRPGDVITAVNRKNVETMEAFREAAGVQGQLLLHIRRGSGALFVLIQ